jgi:hypothetical protein
MSIVVENAWASERLPSESNVRTLAESYLAKRGLTLDDADRAGIELVGNANKVCAGFKNGPALIIPYRHPLSGEPMTYGADGSRHTFVRARYLKSEASEGFIKQRKKAQRFSQPKGSPVFAYFAPNTLVDWKTVLTSTEVPLVITEGEIKGLCACVNGIPTIALGGVNSFLNQGKFLQELQDIVWTDRKVIICFDSDISEKSEIQAAERWLASELKKRGAIVHFARLRLPAGDEQ